MKDKKKGGGGGRKETRAETRRQVNKMNFPFRAIADG